MTIYTPNAIGAPDFTTAPTISSAFLYTESGYLDTVPPPTTFAVSPFMSVSIELLISNEPCQIRFFWSTSTNYGVDYVATETYYTSSTCDVIDTLQVLAPYLTMVLTPLGSPAHVTYTFTANGAVQQYKGPSWNSSSNVQVNQVNVNCAAGTTSPFYANNLSPGQYQFYYSVNVNLTGRIWLLGRQNGAQFGPLTGTGNPTAGTIYSGQVIVGQVQPQYEVINTGASAVLATLSLVGPL